jgi:crossover junction endonuclease EME1
MLMDTTFCMESGQVKTGDDADDTFVKMLQEVSRVTVPMAYGIATKCPNIMSLARGLNGHGPLALEDVRVRPQSLKFEALLIRSL